MPIVAKASGGNFIPAPPGSWGAVCVDVVDLGILEVSFGNQPKKKQHKIRVVWQLSEVRNDNKPHQASKRYTLSLHEKAALRKDLESWRGRKFTDDELKGFDVESVLGVPCLLNIIEERKGAEIYSNITAIMRLPKGMEAPTQRDYVRVVDRASEAVAVAPDQHQQDWDDPYAGAGIDDSDVPF